MNESRREQVADIERREDVRVALQQVSGPKPEKQPVEPLQLAWVATYVLFLAGLAVVLYLLRFHVFPLSPRADAFLQRLTWERWRSWPSWRRPRHSTWLSSGGWRAGSPDTIWDEMLTAALERLGAEPERVLFPKSNMR